MICKYSNTNYNLVSKILKNLLILKNALKMIFNGFTLYLRISLEHLKEKKLHESRQTGNV